ncbi:MarR family winged helix-turn-helix transcriptional regulator [Enterococcus timonensis]|uniref:MarR family winged helix-turn-helix transcriptional regulator n=1 Tax=Enterococcus timonensis TaxID=1852364 RepID=UPI0008D998A5|nr:MarR family winged helix-turn-helix transcriptional regulator [Enterococcus timonensis]
MKNDNQGALLEDYIDVYMSGFKYISDLVSEPTKEFNLSFEQFLIMRDVADGKQVAMSDVATKRGVTKAAISRQIRVMLDNDYIKQERDEVDRRRQYLKLTPKGQKVAETIEKAMTQRFYGWVDLFGEDDTKELLRLMRRVSLEIIGKDKT